MRQYATDKPDLRNPLILEDVFNDIAINPPRIFENVVSKNGKICMFQCKEMSEMSRIF